MSLSQFACTYATLILHDEDISITSDKIATLVKAANVTVESYWPSLFAKLAEKRNVGDLIMNIGAAAPVAVAVASSGPAAGGAAAAAAPAVEEKKEEAPESDDDMGFSLFD
uniref:60S acidic ribosomal protein P1 n=1 Tax=Populus trichocarpa TaxID=3694 RepID=A0A2K1XFX6_POPTR|eukprot:XP_002321361.3 60S acidic ribosomal protein P1-3 [Populus trichocarpa]